MTFVIFFLDIPMTTPTTSYQAKNGLIFSVGEEYANRLGNYLVFSIQDTPAPATMTVEYMTGIHAGKTCTLEIEGQAKVSHNMRIEELRKMKMTELNLQGANESFTLGYIANHGIICIRVKEVRAPWFNETYQRLTHLRAPEANVQGHYYTVSPDAIESCWDYFHVIFPAPPDCFKSLLAFGNPERAIMWDQWGKYSKYNDRDYVLNLFRLGFRLGKKHEIAYIRENLTDKDSFDKGMACIPEFQEEREITSDI